MDRLDPDIARCYAGPPLPSWTTKGEVGSARCGASPHRERSREEGLITPPPEQIGVAMISRLR